MAGDLTAMAWNDMIQRVLCGNDLMGPKLSLAVTNSEGLCGNIVGGKNAD